MNVAEIIKAYKAFESKGCNWSVFASSVFRNDQTQNCTNLVNELLWVGGAYKIIGYEKMALIISNLPKNTIKSAWGGLYNGVKGFVHKTDRFLPTNTQSNFINKVSETITFFGASITGLGGATVKTVDTLLSTYVQQLAITPDYIAQVAEEVHSKERHRLKDEVNLLNAKIKSIYRSFNIEWDRKRKLLSNTNDELEKNLQEKIERLNMEFCANIRQKYVASKLTTNTALKLFFYANELTYENRFSMYESFLHKLLSNEYDEVDDSKMWAFQLMFKCECMKAEIEERQAKRLAK